MSTEIASANTRKAKTIGFWMLRTVLALWFLTVGTAKLLRHPHMLAQFNAVGIGDWFMYFTGTLEIAGALLLLNPVTIAFGGFVLTCVCVGAFVARIVAIHGDVMHDIVAAAILSTITWTHRRQLLNFVSAWRDKLAG